MGSYGENPKGAEAEAFEMEEEIVGPVVAEPPFFHPDIDQEVVQKGWGFDSVEPAQGPGVAERLPREHLRFARIDTAGEPAELRSEEFRRALKRGGGRSGPAPRQQQREE
jgi:hypothetical protein